MDILDRIFTRLAGTLALVDVTVSRAYGSRDVIATSDTHGVFCAGMDYLREGVVQVLGQDTDGVDVVVAELELDGDDERVVDLVARHASRFFSRKV